MSDDEREFEIERERGGDRIAKSQKFYGKSQKWLPKTVPIYMMVFGGKFDEIVKRVMGFPSYKLFQTLSPISDDAIVACNKSLSVP